MRRALADNRRMIQNVALVAALFLVALVLLLRQGYATAHDFLGYCHSCDEVSELVWPSDSEFPIRCPGCREKTAYPARICSEGHIFPVLYLFLRQPCPECGTESVRTLEPDDVGW